MKSSAKNVKLATVDDLFSTEESRTSEKVVEIPLPDLHSFKNHPFKVRDDEAMMETADSVRQYGVLVPAIARPGLLFYGNVILPFVDHFPKDLELYRIMTTKLSEVSGQVE